MESLVKQETQPKPRLIVRLGVFLASHHILFRFILISPSYCSLNASFSPFLFPISLFTIFGSVLFAALRVLLRSSSSLHLPKIHTSRRMLLYRVSYPLIYFLSTVIVWMHICYCYHCYLFYDLFWGPCWVSCVGYSDLLGTKWLCCLLILQMHTCLLLFVTMKGAPVSWCSVLIFILHVVCNTPKTKWLRSTHTLGVSHMPTNQLKLRPCLIWIGARCHILGMVDNVHWSILSMLCWILWLKKHIDIAQYPGHWVFSIALGHIEYALS